MKKRQIELLFFAGGLTDSGTDYAYDVFMNCLYSFFGGGSYTAEIREMDSFGGLRDPLVPPVTI